MTTRQGNKIVRLTDALESTVELLCKIRYCDWPVEGLGIGITAEEIDEVLIKSEQQLPKNRKLNATRKPPV